MQKGCIGICRKVSIPLRKFRKRGFFYAQKRGRGVSIPLRKFRKGVGVSAVLRSRLVSIPLRKFRKLSYSGPIMVTGISVSIPLRKFRKWDSGCGGYVILAKFPSL